MVNEALAEAAKEIRGTQEASTESEKVVEVPVTSADTKEATTGTKVEASETPVDSEKQSGFQKRINQLTAKNKALEEKYGSELAQLKEQIAKLSTPVQTESEEEVPEISSVNDLLKYNKEYMSKYAEKLINEEVRKQLKLVSDSMIQQTESQKLNSKKEKFYGALMEQYGDQFEGTDFIGDNTTLELLKKVEQRFNADPDYWAGIIQDEGLDGMVKRVTKKIGELSNADKVADIVDKASKAKVLTSSDKGIEDLLSQQTTRKGLLQAAAEAIRKRK